MKRMEEIKDLTVKTRGIAIKKVLFGQKRTRGKPWSSQEQGSGPRRIQKATGRYGGKYLKLGE